MARQGITKATMKRNSLGEWPWESGRIEQEPILVSRPNLPHLPNHVVMRAPNPNSHVHATMRPRYCFLYNLQHTEPDSVLCSRKVELLQCGHFIHLWFV
jgi:hypothetical protein